jgi:hypothetical protein
VRSDRAKMNKRSTRVRWSVVTAPSTRRRVALCDRPEGGGQCDRRRDRDEEHGHGTHTASEAASPINGIGTAGVAPEATIVALKAGNAEGFFFTQEVVDAMIYAWEPVHSSRGLEHPPTFRSSALTAHFTGSGRATG